MYFAYTLLLAFAVLLSSPWWLLRLVTHGKYRAGLGERLGRVPQRLRTADKRPAIWVHAVSVGEVLAVASFVQRLRDDFPEHRVVVSTTTKTGQELARKRFGEENVFYFPLDFGFCIRPFLRVFRPELAVIAETEFWPNFLRLAKKSGAQIAVVNARISDRSLPRYRRWRGLLRRVLGNVDVFCAQSQEDMRRLCEIGAPAERVHVSGNLKFDIQPPGETALVAQLRAAIREGGAGPVIVAGSTVEGEEPDIFRGFVELRQQFSGALLIVAPRHPERFAHVGAEFSQCGLPLTRRSEWNGTPLTGGVFLLDSIGELASVYALADIAIVGGSFARRGGHNILEPAWFAKPIVIGPNYENFRDIVEQFRRADAVSISENPMHAALELLNDPTRASDLGCRGRAVLDLNRGATDHTLNQLRQLLYSVKPQPEPHEVA
jgi:3-deoxy-D-manno-octulosonic-acid transferase